MSAAAELKNINLITTPVDILISCPENKRLIISPDCSPAHTLSTWIFITKIPQICLCMCCYGNSNHVFSEDWVLMFIINQTRSVASVEVAQWWSGVACPSYSASQPLLPAQPSLIDWCLCQNFILSRLSIIIIKPSQNTTQPRIMNLCSCEKHVTDVMTPPVLRAEASHVNTENSFVVTL